MDTIAFTLYCHQFLATISVFLPAGLLTGALLAYFKGRG